MQSANYSFEHISQMELKSINNFAIRESIELALEEINYFFDSKERLIDVFIEGIDFSKLSKEYLQQRFFKVLYTSKDLESFMNRLEVRLQRELSKVCGQAPFCLHCKTAGEMDTNECFSFAGEAARTYRLSCATSKAVNTLWKKSSHGLIPKSFKLLGLDFNAGEYFLSTVEMTPEEIKCSISKKTAKHIRGILKQSKIEMLNYLKSEIIAQTLKGEELVQMTSERKKHIMTA